MSDDKACQVCLKDEPKKEPDAQQEVLVKIIYMLLLLFASVIPGYLVFIASVVILKLVVFAVLVVCTVIAWFGYQDIKATVGRVWLHRFRDKHGVMHLHADNPSGAYREFYFGDNKPKYIKERYSGWFWQKHLGRARVVGFGHGMWIYRHSWAGRAELLNQSSGVLIHLSALQAFELIEAMANGFPAPRDAQPNVNSLWDVLVQDIGALPAAQEERDFLALQRKHLGVALMKMRVHLKENPRTAGKSRHATAFKEMISQGLDQLPKNVSFGDGVDLLDWENDARADLGLAPLEQVDQQSIETQVVA